MAGLRPIHHRKLEEFVQGVGCTFVRQQGSHRIYWRSDQVRPVVIPVYAAVPVFIIRNVLRQLRVPASEYLSSIQKL